MKKMNSQIKLGDRWVTCDVCDFGYRYSEMKKGVSGSQKGFYVCPDCFDNQHLLDDWKMTKIRPSYQPGGTSLESNEGNTLPDDLFITQGGLYFVTQDGTYLKLASD